VGKSAGIKAMESIAYILILTLAIGTLFFAIAFREPPRIEKKEEK
jgi:photosystem II PsbT protein